MFDHRISSLLLSLTLLLAAPLAAQTVPPPADAGPIVGIYTTEGIGEGTEVSVELADLPVMLNLFVVLSHPGIDEVSAAAFRLERSAELERVSAWSGHLVDNGHPAWLPWAFPDIFHYGITRSVIDGHVWLIRFGLFVFGPVSDGQLFLRPCTGWSVMEFVGPDDDAARIMLPNSEGLDPENPVFHVRAGTVAVEPSSLSSVKSLFR
jgi:hypothetical protein